MLNLFGFFAVNVVAILGYVKTHMRATKIMHASDSNRTEIKVLAEFIYSPSAVHGAQHLTVSKHFHVDFSESGLWGPWLH